MKNTLSELILRMSLEDVERFWSRVAVAERDNACWSWKGAPNRDGYGRFSARGQTEYAHRIAHALLWGPCAPSEKVRHLCHHPSCCNPRHLEVGSHSDNMQDMAAAGRHGSAKLSPIDVREIHRRWRSPNRPLQRELAEEFGVDRSAISHVVRGATWSCLCSVEPTPPDSGC